MAARITIQESHRIEYNTIRSRLISLFPLCTDSHWSRILQHVDLHRMPTQEKQKRMGRNFQAVVHLLRCCAAARPPVSIDTKRVANPAGQMSSSWTRFELNWVPISEKSFKKVSNLFQIFPVWLGWCWSCATEILVDLLAHSRHGRSYAMILEVDHLVDDN